MKIYDLLFNSPICFSTPNVSFLNKQNNIEINEISDFNKKLIIFYENIEKIIELINNEKIIVLLFNFTKMSFDDDYMKETNSISKKFFSKVLPIDQLKKKLDILQSYYYPDPFSKYIKFKKKYFTFEDWYKIERLKYEDIKFQPNLHSNKDGSYDNKEAIIKVGIINEYIYKNNKYHYFVNEEENIYKYVCKNINLNINKKEKKEKKFTSEVQIIKLSDIKYKNERMFRSIFEVYKNAKEEFSDYIIFGKDVERGINTIEDDAGPPDRIYAYLKTLKEFKLYKSNNKTDFPDDYILTALGCNCSYEGPEHMQDIKVINDRMYDNGNNQKIKFELHLKPSTNSLYGTVRIYISWDDVRERVIVGWIGRHLYLPPKKP